MDMAVFQSTEKVFDKFTARKKCAVNPEERKITLRLKIDTKICPVLDYFEIFMDRTMMSKYAAKYLKIWYELIINDTKLL